MALQVRLKNLEAIFPNITDYGDDGLLSADEAGKLSDEVCSGSVCASVTCADLADWRGLDAFIERTTDRQASFVFHSLGDAPAYLVYSKRGGEGVEGIVDWQTGQLYKPESMARRFVGPDLPGTRQDEALAVEACGALRRRSAREDCVKEVQQTYATFYAGAATYAASRARLQAEYETMNESFIAGTLDEASIRHYLLAYYRIQQAERERSLSRL